MHKSIYYESYTDKIMTVLLHIGDDKMVKKLFYVTVLSLMMGQWGQKHVGVDILKHYCDSNEMYAFVSLQSNN